MKTTFILVLCALLSFFRDPGGKDLPVDYFSLPVDRGMTLSGTFGELRANHFHAGIDIKSLNGRPGEKIFSAAEGYVSRIKVSPFGYGNALYVAHPNGYTTVYAHLDRFTPEIAEYVKQQQYRRKQFAVDLYPTQQQFTLDRGELLGYMGNSGGSSGPHLHFEIRQTSGQLPVNPLLFGLPYSDDLHPEIKKLRVYYLDPEKHHYKIKEYKTSRTEPGRYTIGDTLSEGAWRVAFAVSATDRMNGAPNRNGVYSVLLEVDGTEQCNYAFEEIPFYKTRYLNAHIDYRAYASGKAFFHRCHVLEGNNLDLYRLADEQGVVSLYKDKPRLVRIAVSDAAGNMSTLEFRIDRSKEMTIADEKPSMYTGVPDRRLVIAEHDVKVAFARGTFYAETPVRVARDTASDTYGIQIGDEGIPMHKSATLGLRLPDLPKNLHGKACIIRVVEDERINMGGTVDGAFLVTEVRQLGKFQVGVDTIEPVIQKIEFSEDMHIGQSMVFRVTDDLGTGGKARGLTYEGFVDDRWILFEYDAKRDRLVHKLDGIVKPGEHTLVLRITDDRGNQAVLQEDFTLLN